MATVVTSKSPKWAMHMKEKKCVENVGANLLESSHSGDQEGYDRIILR
jgi:hypothetical protein